MAGDKRRISPAVAIIPVGLGLAAVVGIAALAWAAPPVFTCPYCGATFATEEELNYHIQAEHPEVPPGAEFRVSNLVISPSEVQIGQPVIVSCTVGNIGTEAGGYIVTLGGDFVAEQVVSLNPGQSTIVTFEITPAVAKSYYISVDGLTGTFRAVEESVADIRVENLTIEPTEVYVGEPVTILVRVTNYGTAPGTKTIKCEES